MLRALLEASNNSRAMARAQQRSGGAGSPQTPAAAAGPSGKSVATRRHLVVLSNEG
jgi:hypothetical protein